MSAIAIPASRTTILSTLFERQPVLAAYGLTLVVLSATTLSMQWIDTRTIEGVGIWVKPTKFLFSIGVFALTAAWYVGFVRPERRNSRAIRYVVWATILAGTFELAYIAFQASRGLGSHFNTSTPQAAIMYALMGIGAVVLVSTVLPLAWQILRHPAERLSADFRFALVAGLVLTFVLGGGLGGYMSSNAGHSIGPESGHFPIFGWNRLGGDLRVAHFFGMHFEQALPLLAWLGSPLAPSRRWAIILGGAVLGIAVILGVFVQAIAGRPFPF